MPCTMGYSSRIEANTQDLCRRLGGYMSTARWVEEEEAVRSILTRLSIAVDTSR